MTESELQVDRRRNREQWYSLVHHLLECGYAVLELDGVSVLCSPEGVPLVQLPDGYPERGRAVSGCADHTSLPQHRAVP
jgi:hypothetical protein